MSGPIYTLKNYLVTGSDVNQATKRAYEGIALFFDSHGGYQRIAWNTGSADGNNAFKVWRAVSASQPFDVILKWSYNEFWTDWTIQADYGLGILVGSHASGQAWNGTTNNPNDAHAQPPFKEGSMVFSRPTAAGGAVSSSKDCFAIVPDVTFPTYTLINGAGDNDSFTFVFDTGNNGGNNGILHFERFQPINDNFTFPFFFYSSQMTGEQYFKQNTTYGATTVVSTDEACLTYISISSGVVTGALPIPEKCQVDYDIGYAPPIPLSTSFMPYVFEYPILLVSKETGGEYVGYLTALRKTWQHIANYSRLGNWRMVISQSTNSDVPTLTMHWSGSAASGSVYSSSLFLTGSSAIGQFGQAGIFVDRLGTTDSIVTVVSQTIVTNNYLYRGRIGANYTFQVGSPPAGATDIVIMGIV